MSKYINTPLANSLRADRMLDFGKTVAFLMDERPGFDPEAARAIASFVRERGFYVHEIDTDFLMKKDVADIGFLLVVPHAKSVPSPAQDALNAYRKQGGQLLILGGPLFGKPVERQNGKWTEMPIPSSALDAVQAAGDRFLMEGVAPTHKIFIEPAIERFMTEPEQAITKAVLCSDAAEEIICPIARPHGIGFGMEHRDRMIPLCAAMGDGSRAGGRRGSAAFMMLSNTRGHLVRTNGGRPGNVSATTTGSCVGVIGLTRQNLMELPGAPELIADMVGSAYRALWLFEAGANRLTARPGEGLTLGARLMSLSQDFRRAEVRFTVRLKDSTVFEVTRSVLASAKAYTEVTEPFSVKEAGLYTVVTELYLNGMCIDRVTQELTVETPANAPKDAFIRADGDGFVCGGKPFYAYGTNYWPLFYPSFEREDYWLGWLDKSNYDPLETDRDLEQIASQRMNWVCTRVDGDVLGRSLDTLRDFVARCRRHGLRLMLSWSNAMNPLYYQPEAVEALLRETGLTGDPTLFAYDISWETGFSFLTDGCMNQLDDEWLDWIGDNYGSLARAEADWQTPVDRDAAGNVTHPPMSEFAADGDWRVKVSAYRRFIEHFVSGKWNAAVAHLRSLDPNHMITYRSGPLSDRGDAYLNGTIKHVDFTALEGYSFENTPEGRGGMICFSLLARRFSGNKPVTWVEYGLSLIGLSGNDTTNDMLKWDREKLSAFPEMLEEQVKYNSLFFDTFRAVNAAGTAPWWYAGGFRRVERSDCGYFFPNAEPRPVQDEYRRLADWFLEPREPYVPDEQLTFDPDSTAQGWGRFCLGTGMVSRLDRDFRRANGKFVEENPDWGEGMLACRDAYAAGKRPEIRTPGEGSDSVNLPMLAVGNRPLDGCNPPKYLDAEFNRIILSVNGEPFRICGGESVTVPRNALVTLTASVGNLREARWLPLDGEKRGSVCLCVRQNGETQYLPISRETPYLADADVSGTVSFAASGEVTLRMVDVGVTAFGSTVRFSLTVE